MTTALRLVPDLPDDDPEHLAEWELYGRAAGWTDATFRTRHATLGLFRRHAGVGLHEVTGRQIAAFIASYSWAKPATRATYHRSLTSYYKWLKRAGYRADDPTDLIPRTKVRPGRPRPVPTHAIEKALRRVHNRRTYAYIVIAAYAGLRVHEIAKIRGEDIDVEAGTLYVEGKGGNVSVLPLHPAIARLTSGYPRRGFWFTSPKHRHVSSMNVSQAIIAAFAAVDVEMTAHQLRHWYGTEVLRASGGQLRVAQELLRHASPESTAIYTAVDDGDRRSAIVFLPEVTMGGRPDVSSGGDAQQVKLTDSQLAVLRMVADGAGPSAIATALKLTPGTVKRYTGVLHSKFGAHTRGDLVMRATQAGILRTDDSS